MGYRIELLDSDDRATLSRCFDVYQVLRPHLDQTGFVEQVRAQFREGFRIGYIEREGRIVAAAGYRVATFLAWGKVLYVDDLVTHPEQRGSGIGGALLDWLIEQGRRLGCGQIHLDTGYRRHDAHRLYLRRGFELSCHHMSRELT